MLEISITNYFSKFAYLKLKHHLGTNELNENETIEDTNNFPIYTIIHSAGSFMEDPFNKIH